MKTENPHRAVHPIINTFKKYKSFFIAVHRNPDGDTLGAALCTADILKKMKKSVFVFSADKVPENLKFMPFISSVNEAVLPVNKKFDVCIFFECSTLKRAGNVQDVVENAKKVINIDHHKTHSNYGHINYVDRKSSSTSELVFKIFTTMGKKLSSRQAECLYTGIVTDTGRFYYKSTNVNTFLTTAALLKSGIKPWVINDAIYGVKELPALKLLSRALSDLKIVNRFISVMHLKKKDFAASNALPEHTEDISNYGLMPKGVKVSVLIKELEGFTAVNLRSKDKIDVSRVAKNFGGGGHKNAAGFKTKMSLGIIEKKILKELMQQVKK